VGERPRHALQGARERLAVGHVRGVRLECAGSRRHSALGEREVGKAVRGARDGADRVTGGEQGADDGATLGAGGAEHGDGAGGSRSGHQDVVHGEEDRRGSPAADPISRGRYVRHKNASFYDILLETIPLVTG
jgi:hypothetical protein